ncbi:molybdopterin synthase sulfur carrier subunit [Paucibacter sp. KBW04]|uniref:MoaD/ThiS family protein n=1 Tax=Paucibacter sp. KBW04 TaxID=2153361 RepID=UPI000F56FB9D|nr:MoaD/ThiS family protein [Paucibacter sp. KBW04]RQO63652.1 molybdopterin synthase sulfur carrier subunit [Paucibacter sp. KBW04]
MQIQLRYFASLREQLGAGENLVLESARTVGQVRDLLLQRSDAHGQALARTRALRCALNQTLCAEDALISADAELAFFPPVTGG